MKVPSGKYTREGENLRARYLPITFWSLFTNLLLIFPFNALPSICHWFQTVAMKFIMKHGKSDKDIHNLRQEIEVSDILAQIDQL